MQLFPVRNKTEVLVVDSAEGGSLFALIRVIAIARQAIAQHDRCAIALSGGSTPKRLYELLASRKDLQARVDWSKVSFFWSDERAVPPDHPDSNYGMAMHYLNQPPFTASRFYRMAADGPDLYAASRAYEELISLHCNDGRFDLVLLGLGTDGHTASLFPHTKALFVTDKLVSPNYAPAANAWRMTLTFTCINQAERIIVLAFGKEKTMILRDVLFSEETPDRYPAQRLGTGNATVLYIVDPPAAALLKGPGVRGAPAAL